MKKAIIITECRRWVFNYGETLQAVALNQIVSKMGVSCITASCENQKNDFKGWFLKNIKRYFFRCVKFELFRLKNMKKTMFRSNKKEKFVKLLKNVDMVICGSDCIWYEKCYNEILCLNFPKLQLRKIAYAPSLRDRVVTDDRYKRTIGEWIKNIQYLSTREAEGSKIIKDITGKNVKTVLDPTLLLSKETWSMMSSKRIIKDSYILLYALGKSGCLRNLIKQVKDRYRNRKIIWIAMEGNDYYPEGEELINIGPDDFISLIKYADAVITDSFHGTAFSIIFHRQFFAVKRTVNRNDIYDNDCRITNLLNITGLNNYYQKEDKIDFDSIKINWKDVERRLRTEKKKSINFLKNALYGEHLNEE